jgi:hypothetical protein
MDDFELFNEKQTAKLLRLKPHTLAVWRCRQPEKSPPFISLGRHIW